MKICPACGASNGDALKFCVECGVEFTAAGGPTVILPGRPARPGAFDPAALTGSIVARAAALQGKRRADIVFVLDCTGSMQGEIDAIRDAITGFADTITSDGVRVRVGLVEFRDRLIHEEQRVLTFDGAPFTADPAAFRRELGTLRASGGGDEPESSLDAVKLAARQPFDADASKVLVLITDAPPHLPDRETKSIDEVVQAIRGAGINQMYVVMRTQDPRSQVYLKLLEGAQGQTMAFELGTGDEFRRRAEDFKRTLMSLGKTISAATR